jgi:peptidoglycan/xylan/chitin deacetylase (PgdA/CDA1 family)
MRQLLVTALFLGTVAMATATTATGRPAAMPSEAAQQEAVARVARLGLPIYEAGRQGKYVAITFDDGPGPYTPKVLDELKRYGFRATFFFNGKNFAQGRDVLRRTGREANVGDHTWSHPYLPGIPPGQQVAQTERSMRAISDITTTHLNMWLRNRGVLPVLWSTDSRDSLGANRQEILSLAKAGTKPGAILLFHENRGQTYWAINRYLPWLKKQGYTAVTVPELLALNPVDPAAVRARAGSGIGFR